MSLTKVHIDQFTGQIHKPSKSIVVCQVNRKRKLDVYGNTAIDIIPWQEFLEMLWQGKII